MTQRGLALSHWYVVSTSSAALVHFFCFVNNGNRDVQWCIPRCPRCLHLLCCARLLSPPPMTTPTWTFSSVLHVVQVVSACFAALARPQVVCTSFPALARSRLRRLWRLGLSMLYCTLFHSFLAAFLTLADDYSPQSAHSLCTLCCRSVVSSTASNACPRSLATLSPLCVMVCLHTIKAVLN